MQLHMGHGLGLCEQMRKLWLCYEEPSLEWAVFYVISLKEELSWMCSQSSPSRSAVILSDFYLPFGPQYATAVCICP